MHAPVLEQSRSSRGELEHKPAFLSKSPRVSLPLVRPETFTEALIGLDLADWFSSLTMTTARISSVKASFLSLAHVLVSQTSSSSWMEFSFCRFMLQ